MLTVISRLDVPGDVRRGGTVQTLLSPRTVGCTSGFTGLASIEPGDAIAEHYHPYSEEFVYVVAGPLELYADGELHGLATGDGVVLPIGTRHRFVNRGDTTTEIVFHLGPLAPRPELGHVDTEAERLAALDRATPPSAPAPAHAPAPAPASVDRVAASDEAEGLHGLWRWLAMAAMSSPFAPLYVDWGLTQRTGSGPARRRRIRRGGR